MSKGTDFSLGRAPTDYLVACVGGGSNAMGPFYPFVDDHDVKLWGVEAAGQGLDTGKRMPPLSAEVLLG